MDSAENKVKQDAEDYRRRLYDFIPINPGLIDHVRRLDGFNDAELLVLRQLLTDAVQKVEPQFKFDDAALLQDPYFRRFVEITFKIHQHFALVDVNYEHVFSTVSESTREKNLMIHFQEVAEQLSRHNGLNYVPRERTTDGRVFEHAADCKVLIDHLTQLPPDIRSKGSNFNYTQPQKEDMCYYVQIVDELTGKESSADLERAKLTQKYEQNILEELNITKERNVVVKINKSFIDLAMKANGKADLYFHAYFWEQYLKGLDVVQAARAIQQRKEREEVAETADGTSVPSRRSETPVPKIDIFSSKYPFMKRLTGLSLTLTKVIVNIKKFPFTEKMYQKYVLEFGKRQLNKKMRYLEEIQRSLFVAQIADDKEGLYWIEKLLIQLQGYCDISIRDQAIVLLNMLYDGVDWQLLEAFRPTIRCVGQHFVINCIVHKNPKCADSQIFLGLGAPSPIEGNNFHLLTWHKIESRNIIREDNVMLEISINFGKFWKCGFYDWRFVSISEDGKLQPMEIIGKPEPSFPHVQNYHDDYYEENEEDVGSIAQGRFVVHARGMRDHSFHEVQIDYQDARIDKNTNQFVQRGTFSDVEHSISKYAKQGISALYLMGTLERDNYPTQHNYSDRVEYRRDDASALAAIDRSVPNRMLGGEQGLAGVMRAAKQNRVKVIVDSMARISSSRHHRKYNKLLLNYLDEDGRRHICYGTDGQAQKFEDTAMLNYRKLESWDLLIDEVMSYTSKFGIDGIHLDNGQAWPQIMEPDIEELSRIDVDGHPAYTADDFMNGEVVIRNENHGYWNSNNMETYPNPFFIKMCKKLWFQNPDFMIIGECWGGYMFEHRQIILARSGIVPRLFKLPVALSSIMGKRLHNDGRLESCEKQPVAGIKQWYEESRRFLPNGTILMQSSTSHTLPLPAYLYGQGTWAAIDTLFFMSDLPITFMGELEGQIYKVGDVATVFQQDQASISSNNQGELRRTNSQIMRALKDGEEFTQASSEHSAMTTPTAPEQRRGLPKVRSGINIAQLYVEAKEGQIQQKEHHFKQNLNPTKGFDLSQISTHYMHRRQLRKQKMVLRYGELIMLGAKDKNHQPLSDILVYARYSLMETVIIATNMSENQQNFILDLQNVLPTFQKAYANNTVVIVKQIIGSETDDTEYYFLREFVESMNNRSLPPFRSLLISVTICDDDQFIFKKCLTTSIERTKRCLLSGQSIEQEQISLLFSDCVEHNPSDIRRFANVIGSIQASFLDKLNVSFRDLFVHNSKLVGNLELSSRLTAMTGYLIRQAGGQMTPPIRAAQAMHDGNQLGPIIFCTPELGRWSTVGGLGVMVDELSIGLADLGQQVIVISPYYERNRKGQTGYLAQDPAGIRYVDNMHVDIGGGCNIGIHEGTVKGVKVVFLHNSDLYPSPYPDTGPEHTVHQIAVFGKACLEYCCKRQMIPAICVTNDWFTGLIPAYAKVGHFGDTFKGTTFLHICHNLQETYEGRIHLDSRHGTLEGLHQLPKDWLIDPQWKNSMINPSRCAIMLTDQWATVSKSYREDLLNSSSLSWLLRQKPNPFAFPNGIPIPERTRKLDAVAPDHTTAKKKLQLKYFKFGELDDSIPLFAFVGRVTSQKGVHLILDTAEHLIQKFNYKVQFIVGGPANMREPYAAGCAHKMWHLRNKYPHCFWAAPEEFFTDGSLVNRGADFGLMPSAFEPGGIVQHEFFVGGTPVVAFKTGGLKDSVIEYMWDSETGSGYTFESHTAGDMIGAMERAVGTFRNKPKYLKLRENARKATMDGEVVSKAWLGEFYRLKNKIMVNYAVVKDLESKFQMWHPGEYQPISIIQEIFGSDKKRQIFQEIDFGAADDEMENDSGQFAFELDNMMSAFDQLSFSKVSQTFTFTNRGPRYNRVQLCGSFDNWQVRHDLNFDPFTNQWFTVLHIKPGQQHCYKYITNNDNWVVNDDEPKMKDNEGNVNNTCGTTM